MAVCVCKLQAAPIKQKLGNEGTEEARGDKEAEGDEEAKETQGLPAKIRRNAVPILGAGLGAFVLVRQV